MVNKMDMFEDIDWKYISDVTKLKKYLKNCYGTFIPHSGVYFLFQGDNLLYVGESVNMRVRIFDHHNIPFTHYAFIGYETEPMQCVFEIMYIWKYRPPFNKKYNPSYKMKNCFKYMENGEI